MNIKLFMKYSLVMQILNWQNQQILDIDQYRHANIRWTFCFS